MTYTPTEYPSAPDRRPESPLTDREKELLAPRTIKLNGAWKIPPANPEYSLEVPLIDAIAAVQDAGYLVYEIGELPEVVTSGPQQGGGPKLPANWGATRKWVDNKWIDISRVQAFYEEAFGKLALARWWEKEEERVAKRKTALLIDLESVPAGHYEELADNLLARGWRRG